ncbi:MAG TPA: lysophospholipid acyltransferase family protein [Polyangiaceae bacterium]
MAFASGSIDGFRPEYSQAFTAFDPSVARRFYAAVERLTRLAKIQVQGLENLPRGRALLVANHTFGWDVVFVASAVWHAQGRPIWFLGEHVWWKFPFLRRLAAALGTVDGTPENVDRLLAKDELVLVLPGGLREAVKPRELRYRLLWGNRYGFVRAAIRNHSPIVPVAAIGADDLFDFVGNAFRRGERLLRHSGIPIPLPARILPIPHLVQLRFAIGEPIPCRFEPADAENPAALQSLRHEVEGALHELIERELATRAGIDLG